MDDVPYEFIERVFAKLSYPTIHGITVRAPLWQEAARVHKEKLQRYAFVTRPSEHGLLYGFIREGMPDEKAMTLEEFAQLDWRYHRVVGIRKGSIDERVEIRHPIRDRMAEIAEFVSQFNLEQISFFPWHDMELRMVDECCKHDLQTEKLTIMRSNDERVIRYLLRQLKSDRLEELVVEGFLERRLWRHLEAFVCRPNFKSLACSHFEGIERILAYWRSMETPWKVADIECSIDSQESLEQIVWAFSRMQRESVDEDYGDEVLFVESRGDYQAVVKICYGLFIITFRDMAVRGPALTIPYRS